MAISILQVGGLKHEEGQNLLRGHWLVSTSAGLCILAALLAT